MVSKRKFFRTVIQLEILSDVQLRKGVNIIDIGFRETQGVLHCESTEISNSEIDGVELRNRLNANDVDTEFFNLDSTGNDDIVFIDAHLKRNYRLFWNQAWSFPEEIRNKMMMDFYNTIPDWWTNDKTIEGASAID